jgi:DNA-binding MarR family transcriptional regulator
MRQPRHAPAAPLLTDVLQFMRLLWALNHELDSLSKRMNSRYGVTGPQRLVLRIIGRAPGISAGDLAATLHVHPSTLTGILHRLVERELIKRHRDPADARRARFTLTPRGRAIDALRRGTVEAAIQKALRRAPAADQASAERVLATIVELLERER